MPICPSATLALGRRILPMGALLSEVSGVQAGLVSVAGLAGQITKLASATQAERRREVIARRENNGNSFFMKISPFWSTLAAEKAFPSLQIT